MRLVQFPGNSEAKKAVDYLESRWPRRPQVAIVLGSGLKEVVHWVREPLEVPYRSIPGFPQPSVAGHGGSLYLGSWENVSVAILEGRVHLYEGYTPAQVVFAVRVLALAGLKVFVLTCAAGGITPRATRGSFMIFSDHLNFQGANPLVGLCDEHWGSKFADLTDAYDRELRHRARKAAAALRLRCFEGVYASVLGPSYETPAEIRALKRLGADAVGMSTVPEVIALRQLGARVVALATITNRAAGLSRKPLSHDEVLAVGKRASQDLACLLAALLPSLVVGNGM